MNKYQLSQDGQSLELITTVDPTSITTQNATLQENIDSLTAKIAAYQKEITDSQAQLVANNAALALLPQPAPAQDAQVTQ